MSGGMYFRKNSHTYIYWHENFVIFSNSDGSDFLISNVSSLYVVLTTWSIKNICDWMFWRHLSTKKWTHICSKNKYISIRVRAVLAC